MKTKTPCFLSSSITLISVAVLGSSPARAATLYWDGNSASWSTLEEWSEAFDATSPDPALIPGSLDTVHFNIAGLNIDETVTLDADQSAKGLVFDSTGTVTIASGIDASKLTVGSSGIVVSTGAGVATVSAPLGVLGGAETPFNVAAGGILNLSGAVTTAGGSEIMVGKTGLGILNLTGQLFQPTDTNVRRIAFSNGITNLANTSIHGSVLTAGNGGVNAYVSATHSAVNISNQGQWWQQFFVGQSDALTSYTMHGGTMTGAGSGLLILGYNGKGKAILSLDGGAHVDVPWVWMGESDNSVGIMVVRNATVDFSDDIQAGGAKGAGIIHQLDGNVRSGMYLGFQFRMNQSSSWGIYNLNGGTLECPEIRSGDGTANFVQNNSYFNFHGGTLKPSGNSSNFIRSTLTGANLGLHAPQINVYSEGAVINTNGQTIAIRQPMMAPAGQGVSGGTIAIPSVDQGEGYKGAPAVVIARAGADSTGAAATAIANMMDDGLGNGTFKIDSITITNPGVNYTESPILSLVGGDPTTAAVLPALTIDANVSGGLTKEGTGSLTLTAANTYPGATTVAGGTLVVDTTATEFVLNDLTSLALGGGSTFQLIGLVEASRTQTVSGLTVNPGGNTIDVTNPGTDTSLDLRGGSGTLGINILSGGTVDFKSSDGIVGSTARVLTTRPNDASGILGGWATTNGGADFAMKDVFDIVVPFTGYADMPAQGPGYSIADSVTTNYRITTAGTSGAVPIASAMTNINTLSQTSVASVIDTSPGTLRVGTAGGILITPDAEHLTIGTAADSGILTAGGDANHVAGNLYLANFSLFDQLLTVNSVISDNGGGLVDVTASGPGKVVLNGSNTYSGGTFVGAGTLSCGAHGVLGIGPVTVVGGTLDLAGFTDSVGSVTLTAGAIDDSIGGGILTSTSGFTLNGSAATTVNAILAGSVGLVKSGHGTATLGKVNTYTGNTTIETGTLVVSEACLHDASTITVGTLASTDAILKLDHAVSDTVDKLFIDGVQMAAGTYGSSASAATNQLDGQFEGTGTLNVLTGPSAGSTPFEIWAAASGLDGTAGKENGPNDDPDNDGRDNLLEFALNGNPLSGANDGKVLAGSSTLGDASKVLTLTLPVRSGATFSGATGLVSEPIDGVVYTIQGSDSLMASSWNLAVTEITGPDAAVIQEDLPGLSSGDWIYRTFRSPGTVTDGDPSDFLRAGVRQP